jgi:hypothetical protein
VQQNGAFAPILSCRSAFIEMFLDFIILKRRNAALSISPEVLNVGPPWTVSMRSQSLEQKGTVHQRLSGPSR